MIRKLQKSDREQLIKLFWEFTKNSQKNFIAEDLGEFHQYKDQEVTYNKDADDYCAGKLVVFVVEEGDKLVGYSAAKITEKPENPDSNMAVTGVYIYDKHVFEFIDAIEPSDRGELEITDVNNKYVEKGQLRWGQLKGYWWDAGTFDTLLEANNYWAKKSKGEEDKK